MEQREIGDILSPITTERIRGWAEAIVISTSQTSLGQGIFRLFDSFLWVVEKCAQWSLPAHEVATEENGKMYGKIELVRPLPWILFLPGLVILRIIRVGFNIGSYFFGYAPIQPSGMVKIIQRSRRQLKAMNMRAMKASRDITSSKDKRLTMVQAKKALIKSIRLTLSTLSCLDASNSSHSPPPTKIRISHTDFEQASTPDEKSTTESVESPTNKDMKRKHSQVSANDEISDESDDETLEAKLDRLASIESDQDSDFNPAECAVESSSTSSESEEEDNLSTTEIKDILNDAKKELINTELVKMLLRQDDTGLQKQETIPEQIDNTEDYSQLVGSSEIPNQTITSSAINDFINGEIVKTVPSSQSKETDGEDSNAIKAELQSPITEQTSEAQKQTPEDQAQKSKVRSSNVNTNFLTHERKGNKHRKSGRK